MTDNPLPPQIERYAFGSVTIDGQPYSADVIILPDRIVADWWREAGHSLAVADLGAVLEARPDVLVVGTGAHGLMAVPDATRDALAAAGIELIAERTGAACQTYNRLCRERRTVAALHLTC